MMQSTLSSQSPMRVALPKLHSVSSQDVSVMRCDLQRPPFVACFESTTWHTDHNNNNDMGVASNEHSNSGKSTTSICSSSNSSASPHRLVIVPQDGKSDLVSGSISPRLGRARFVRLVSSPTSTSPPIPTQTELESPEVPFVPEPVLIRTTSFNGGGSTSNPPPSSVADTSAIAISPAATFRNRIAHRPFPYRRQSISPLSTTPSSPPSSPSETTPPLKESHAPLRVFTAPPPFSLLAVNPAEDGPLCPRLHAVPAARHPPPAAFSWYRADHHEYAAMGAQGWSPPPDDFNPYLPPALQPPEHLPFVAQHQRIHRFSPRARAAADAPLQPAPPPSLSPLTPLQPTSVKSPPSASLTHKRVIEAVGGKQAFIQRMKALYHPTADDITNCDE